MSTGLERRSLLSWMTEPGERAPTRVGSADTNAENFICTDTGTTTTLVSASLNVATTYTYVGRIIKCIKASNAQNEGVEAIVLEFVPAADALVFTSLPAATAAGDQFVMYLPPDPIVVVTTSAAGVIAAERGDYAAEVDSYYVGDVLVNRYGNNAQGESRTVTGFTQATGTFTHTAFTGNPTVASLMYLRRFPKTWGPPSVSWKREDLVHEAQRLDFSHERSIGGSKTWSATVTIPLKGSGTAAGNGTAGVAPPELDRPLSALMTKTTNTGESIVADAANTVQTVQITNGTAAQFNVGSLCLDSFGRVAMVYTTGAGGGGYDEVTVHPPFFTSPEDIAGQVLYGGVTYTPKSTGHKTMTLDYFEGGITNVHLYGGMPKIKIADFARNRVPKMVFDFTGNHYVETNYAQPSGLTPSFDTIRPIDAKDAYAILSTGTVGSSTEVRLTLESAEIDFGIEIGQEDAFSLPDAVYGNRYLGHMCTVNVVGFWDTASPSNTYAEVQRYLGGQQFTLLLQHGKVPGNTVAFYAHRCEWLDPQHSEAGGLRKISFKAKVCASDATSIPDFALGFL